MRFPIHNLILVLGIAGFLALLGGCLVVIGYLLCTSLAERRHPHPSPANESLVEPVGSDHRWNVSVLVVLLGGALLSVECALWLWHVALPARPVLAAASLVGPAATETGRANLFPWE